MNAGRIASVLAIGAGLVLSGLGARAVEAADHRTAVVRPAKGGSVAFGDKHAVGHYRAEAGACLVTLVIADRGLSEDAIVGAGNRLTMTVKPGKATLYETADGAGLEVGCTPAAAAMTLKAIDRIGS